MIGKEGVVPALFAALMLSFSFGELALDYSRTRGTRPQE